MRSVAVVAGLVWIALGVLGMSLASLSPGGVAWGIGLAVSCMLGGFAIVVTTVGRIVRAVSAGWRRASRLVAIVSVLSVEALIVLEPLSFSDRVYGALQSLWVVVPFAAALVAFDRLDTRTRGAKESGPGPTVQSDVAIPGLPLWRPNPMRTACAALVLAAVITISLIAIDAGRSHSSVVVNGAVAGQMQIDSVRCGRAPAAATGYEYITAQGRLNGHAYHIEITRATVTFAPDDGAAPRWYALVDRGLVFEPGHQALLTDVQLSPESAGGGRQAVSVTAAVSC